MRNGKRRLESEYVVVFGVRGEERDMERGLVGLVVNDIPLVLVRLEGE